MTFQSSYSTILKQLISTYEKLIEDEKNLLRKDLQHLDTTIETGKRHAEQRLTAEIANLK